MVKKKYLNDDNVFQVFLLNTNNFKTELFNSLMDPLQY